MPEAVHATEAIWRFKSEHARKWFGPYRAFVPVDWEEPRSEATTEKIGEYLAKIARFHFLRAGRYPVPNLKLEVLELKKSGLCRGAA